MGSGSFGNGSGSFGWFGSHDNATSTDSAHDRILALTKLTGRVNDHPEIAVVRSTIESLLQDRTRAAFFKITLSDPLVVSSYKSLLSMEADLRSGTALNKVVSQIGGSSRAPLSDLADVISQRGRTSSTDERTEEIVRRTVTDILLRTVGNSQSLYYETPIDSLGGGFSATPLKNTADIYLGTLISEAVRRDLLNLSSKARAVIAQASKEIAVRWTDRFRERGRAEGVAFSEIMQTIGAEYSSYSRDNDA